jgi:hypothetical protein
MSRPASFFESSAKLIPARSSTCQNDGTFRGHFGDISGTSGDIFAASGTWQFGRGKSKSRKLLRRARKTDVSNLQHSKKTHPPGGSVGHSGTSTQFITEFSVETIRADERSLQSDKPLNATGRTWRRLRIGVKLRTRRVPAPRVFIRRATHRLRVCLGKG